MKNIVRKNKRALMYVFMIALLAAPLAVFGTGAADKAAEHLSGVIPFKTISYQDHSLLDKAEFLALHDYLKKAYPLIHEKLELEKVNELSLLYTWKGTDPSLKPAIFAGHIDVVPIAPGTEGDWTQPPFSGNIADGYVWGRGAIDCKGIVIAVMDAVEELLAEGYTPKRTIYLAFGHDEEVGGWEGAHNIATLLESRGVQAEYVIDESGFIIDGSILGINKLVSLVGIAEKGYLTLELKVKAEGGHSSMPPPETAIGVLAGAIDSLEKHPFPSRLEGVSVKTFESLAPEMPAYMRLAIKSRWLTGGLIKNRLSKINATNALIRTTTAPTIIEAGTKENVLPQEARAVVNFRILPGDDVDYVVKRVNKVIDDPRVEVEIIGIPREPSKVSSTDSEGYEILKRTIAEVYPETLMAPYLVLGGTDARHYDSICDSVYRFSPLRMSEEDQEMPHGTNERISVDNLTEMVGFYKQMIKNSE